jgi:hypothetical protein
MDSDATLRQIRAICDRQRHHAYGDMAQLIELVDALDGALCDGAPLPVQWKARR